MPEGDTIFRAATTLRKALAGKCVTAFRSDAAGVVPRAASVVGRTVRSLDAHGKHLLIRFADAAGGELILHTHMQIDGSWHVYRPGERWRRAPARARVVIETADLVVPCFDAPTVELLTEPELARHRWLGGLGQDAMADDFDMDAALARLRALAAVPVGVAIIDQRVFGGVGNVFKSEVLFIERVSPFRAVRSLSDASLRGLLITSREQLRANRSGAWPRRTRPAARRGAALWVYGRAGRPCRACATPIAVRRQGDAGRSTYFCPACQIDGGAAARSSPSVGASAS